MYYKLIFSVLPTFTIIKYLKDFTLGILLFYFIFYKIRNQFEEKRNRWPFVMEFAVDREIFAYLNYPNKQLGSTSMQQWLLNKGYM